MSTSLRTTPLLTCFVAAFIFCGAAVAADSPAKEVEKRYKQESVACIQLKDRAAEQACKKEALAARAEAKQGNLIKNDADFAANAQARCKGLPAPEEKTCLARIRGEGTRSGSVQGGGILRELTMPVVPQGAAASRPQ